jgi:hypothetical protein
MCVFGRVILPNDDNHEGLAMKLFSLPSIFNFEKHNASYEASSHSAGQEIPGFLRVPRVHFVFTTAHLWALY